MNIFGMFLPFLGGENVWKISTARVGEDFCESVIRSLEAGRTFCTKTEEALSLRSVEWLIILLFNIKLLYNILQKLYRIMYANFVTLQIFSLLWNMLPLATTRRN